MGHAERLTQHDAVRWARWQADRTQETHNVYRVDPVADAVGHTLAGIRAVLPRFYVRPESADAPDGAVLVASLTFSEKRASDSTAGRDAR